jgi:hypothetical protein
MHVGMIVAGIGEAALAEPLDEPIRLRLPPQIHRTVGTENFVEQPEVRRNRVGDAAVGGGHQNHRSPCGPLRL